MYYIDKRFLDEVERIFFKAWQLYDFRGQVEIHLNKMEDHTNGIAIYDPNDDVSSIIFNLNKIRKKDKKMTTETIPHEIAHLICFKEGLGSEHCERWHEICKSLGGSGEAVDFGDFKRNHFTEEELSDIIKLVNDK